MSYRAVKNQRAKKLSDAEKVFQVDRSSQTRKSNDIFVNKKNKPASRRKTTAAFRSRTGVARTRSHGEGGGARF